MAAKVDIKAIAKAKGIAMTELARRLGISYQSLYAAIHGNPSLAQMQRIADALGVRVRDIIREEEGGK